MKARSFVVALVGLTVIASGCSKKKAPPGVAPTPVNNQPPPPPIVPPPPPPTNTGNNTGNNNNGAGDPNATRAALLGDIADRIHFEYDKADISSADAARLDRKAAIMRANPSLKIRIIGNCDERGSDSYNITLGMKRATAARDYLVKAGVNTANIEIASLGRESPVDRAGTEDAMAKNRRDEFEATAGTQNLVGAR